MPYSWFIQIGLAHREFYYINKNGGVCLFGHQSISDLLCFLCWRKVKRQMNKLETIVFCCGITSKVASGWAMTRKNTQPWWLYFVASLEVWVTEYHGQISYSVTLSCSSANHSLLYPRNTQHQAEQQQVSIWCDIVGASGADSRLLNQFSHTVRWEKKWTNLATVE